MIRPMNALTLKSTQILPFQLKTVAHYIILSKIQTFFCRLFYRKRLLNELQLVLSSVLSLKEACNEREE